MLGNPVEPLVGKPGEGGIIVRFGKRIEDPRRRSNVSKASEKANLVKVKTALAEKCDRLARATHSEPKRKTLKYQAARFRRQAADLTRS
jgi:hypothetical protein